jgi:DNA-binding SARP family transcriptional activator
LLAFLSLNANTVVSRDRLVDVLWGSEPPKSAVSSLQVYVHGLRRALGGERIERHGTGYRLHLDSSALDLSRFERLVDQASADLASGRAADAAEDLRRALNLWRGQPLGASLSPDDARTQERVTEYVVAELGPERTEELRAEGAATALDELLDEVASRT